MDEEIKEDMKELYELTAKVARRVLYDLKHCIESLPSDRYDLYRSRCDNFATILEAATGSKDYRHRLHRTIASLGHENGKLKSILKENGIDIPEDNPF